MDKIRFCRDIYDEELVREAMVAFSVLAVLTYDVSDGVIQLIIDEPKCSISLFEKEFENYMIDLGNKKKRW